MLGVREHRLSYSHKAFVFDSDSFERELALLLRLALAQDEPKLLISFIETNRHSLRDPYEGEPLSPQWQSLLSSGDVQELGDFALTRYYQPTEDFGMAEDWNNLSESLPEAIRSALLGDPLVEVGTSFDPGRMGSYFQSPSKAVESLRVLQGSVFPSVEAFISGLSEAVNLGHGIYVTF